MAAGAMWQLSEALAAERWALDTAQLSVSMIIPALNEEKCIGECVRHLRSLFPAPLEVIVVDGGSTDGTVRAARKAGARVLRGPRGRARQMNAGAAVARSGALCFVHADSTPPASAVACVRAALADGRVVLGGFRTVIADQGRRLRLMTAHQLVKTWYLVALFRPLSLLRGGRIMFGDQTLFCRAADFARSGGFDPALRIMEDADLGRVRMVLHPPALTSGRRLAAWGNPWATYVHVAIGLSWYLGASPQQLEDLYERLYTDRFR
ncbi:hypothetical protein WJX81_005918 [Elliptochloris bilobata]|uniref:Glycosyltransferase 2-like domain-containing protein n=1 Tax=Elliptochloris bilobata TaxID=381761 RepID=A0AAW1RCQ9_9CHLO